LKGTIFVLGALVFLLAACSSGTAELVLEQTSYDLGEVINGEVRTIEVILRNAGSSALVIESVTTSCGCTSAEVSPTTIPPGESGLLLVEFDSGAHGPESNGPVMRQVFISSNDSDEPELEFRFSADVKAPEA
jgi:hypothetical protein